MDDLKRPQEKRSIPGARHRFLVLGTHVNCDSCPDEHVW